MCNHQQNKDLNHDQSHEQHQQVAEEDLRDNEEFLRSLLRNIELMSHEDRLEFRREVTLLVMRYAYPEEYAELVAREENEKGVQDVKPTKEAKK